MFRPLPSSNNILLVGNFAADTGYAWKTIQEYFVALGQMFIERGNHAVVCFPELRDVPARFKNTKIKVLRFNFSKSRLPSLYRFIRKHGIGTVYLTDSPTYSWRYFFSRLAGVRTIIVHKRTSEGEDVPGAFKTQVKRLLNTNLLVSADQVIVVSEYIRRGVIRVACFPEERIHKIWNGADIGKFKPEYDPFVTSAYGIEKGKKIIFAYSRAIKYKGIQVLIEAARILVHEKRRQELMFLYCGDGPDLEYLRGLVTEFKLSDYFLCPGKTEDIDRILKGVDIVVVPSLWEEPFGLAVIEAMATEKVVIASNVGGIVDIINDSVDGFLVRPGDSEELVNKIVEVLNRPQFRQMIGKNARETVVRKFNIVEKKKELLEFVEQTSALQAKSWRRSA